MIWGLRAAVEESRRQGRLERATPPRPTVEELVEALKPFAALARQRYPNEGGAPSFIDIMTRDGEFNELELRSHVAASDHVETLDAEDFRRAERLLRDFPA